MGSDDFAEPGGFWGLIFRGEDFYDVTLFETVVKIGHFAVDFDADDMTADFRVEAEGEVERKRTFGEVDNVAFRGVDENFVSKKVKAEFFNVDFFTFFKAGGGFLEFGNPEKVGREMLDFTFFVVFCELLFVVIEACGETAFGIFVHLASADLELDNFLVFSDDGGVERLVAVLFRNGDIIFDALVHRGIEGVDEAESEVTRGDVGDDNAEGGEVVDFSHVLVVFSEFFMKRIDGFDSTGDFEIDFFFFQEVGDFFLDLFESARGLLVGLFDKVF